MTSEVSEAREALGEELWVAVARSRDQLAKAGESKAVRGWLKPQLDSPEGTHKVYGMMEELVSKQTFLTKLSDAQASSSIQLADCRQAALKEPHPATLQPGWWQEPADQDGVLIPEADDKAPLAEQQVGALMQPQAEPLGSYVMVEKEDVLEALGTFVAAYLAELPQAQNMPPAELQLAIKRAFKELRKSKVQQLWGWGKAIYRCISFSYGAFTVYENPWLVRALLTAIWTASRVMLGFII